jgi:hypothetical protein
MSLNHTVPWAFVEQLFHCFSCDLLLNGRKSSACFEAQVLFTLHDVVLEDFQTATKFHIASLNNNTNRLLTGT